MFTNTRTHYRIILLLLLLVATREATAENSLSFIENKGQVCDQYGKFRGDIDFKLETPGVTVFIGKGELHYQFARSGNEDRRADNRPIDARIKHFETTIYRMDVALQGINTAASLKAEDITHYTENYYLQHCPDGVTAHSFSKVTYQDIYPGIDWVLYVSGNQLKYDFVVHKGADAKQIRMKYSGATELTLEDNAIVASTPFGSITETKPYCYDGNKREVASSYVLQGNELSFDIAPYTGTLVIDPALHWSTYYGGTDSDLGLDLATDKFGNSYLITVTRSNNLATSGAYQTTLPSIWESCVITRFNTAGVRQWATYYGIDGIRAAIDATGNLVVVGYTQATSGFATIGTQQGTNGGSYDAVLAKFNSAGQRIWSTYYGGLGDDYAVDVCVDVNNDIFLAGGTYPMNGASTGLASANAHQATPSSDFLAKFSPGGLRLWGTFYNNNKFGLVPGTPYSVSITTDKAGNVFMTGSTMSNTGIATPGAYRTSYTGWPDVDAYLVKFNASGVRLWGTYYGGSDDDYGFTTTCDNDGNVYFGGITQSMSGIASPGAPISAIPGSDCSYMVKFGTNGNRIWGTYGPPGMWWTELGLRFDGNRSIFMTGTTLSTFGVATPGAYQTTKMGVYDAMLQQYNTNGQLQWGSYFGGLDFEDYARVNTDSCGNLYYSGHTKSTSNIATTGAHQTVYGGTGGGGSVTHGDGFLARFTRQDTNVYIKPTFIDTVLCTGNDLLNVPFGVTYPFQASNTFTVQLSSPSGSFASPVTIGTLSSNTGGNIACTLPVNTTPGVNYKIRVVASAPADVSEPMSVNIHPTINAPTIQIVVAPNDTVCVGDTAIFYALTTNAGNNPQFQWQINNVDVPGATGSMFTMPNVTTAAFVQCKVTGNHPCMSATPTITSNNIKLLPLPNVTPTVTITATPDSIIKLNTSVTFTATYLYGGTAPPLQWYKNAIAIPGATGLSYTATLGNQVWGGDKISVHMISNEWCRTKDTAKSKAITVYVKLGVDDIKQDGFAIYPNPNAGNFTIAATDGITIQNIELVNMLGQVVYANELLSPGNNEFIEVDLRHKVASGIYQCRIRTVDGKLLQQKLVIEN